MDVRLIASDVGATEGPVVTRDGYFVFTSIDQGRVYRIKGGRAEVLAETGGGPNGATEGKDGSIFISQNGGKPPAHRWPMITGGIQAIRPDGTVDFITTDPVSPNDLCFGPDGYLYVTDPTRTPRRDDGRLWRCDTTTGEAELLLSVSWYPNGIGFGLENDAVYVASTGNRRIIRYPLQSGGTLGKAETFVQLDIGRPDGFAFDVNGNLVVAALEDQSGVVATYDTSGRLVDVFKPGPSRYTNVALSEDRTLYVTDSKGHAVLAVEGWPHPGLRLHPFRIKS